MPNTDNTIEIKTLMQLKDKQSKEMQFFIPSYQRGYRWTTQEVHDLLSDLLDFDSQNHTQSYCLQPIVVREMPDGQWEVIDGQQRLTTIYIFFEIAEGEVRSARSPFVLSYQTRDGSKQYLQNLSNGSSMQKQNENLDYYYMANAWNAMQDWFKDQGDIQQIGRAGIILDILQKMIKDTQIIWYQINDTTVNPVDIFTKLNMGKIPLTNAELIKALFLNPEKRKEPTRDTQKRQLEISSEWDRLEQSLQDDVFWMFLTNNEKKYDTRIDFIFDLLAEEKNQFLSEPIKDRQNPYFTFLVFDRLFKESDVRDNLWEEIGRYLDVFKEWYKDSNIYHRIGYLISIKYRTAGEIKHETQGKRKSEIIVYLDDQIRASVKDISDLGDLSYSDRSKVKKVLLLFNIITLTKCKDAMRFPFDLYKIQQWDIEHIHSVAAKTPETVEDRIAWLRERKKELLEMGWDEAGEKIDLFTQSVAIMDPVQYEDFCGELDKTYGRLEVDDISNLTLLDSETNRAYKNAFFEEKRRVIIARDRDAVFIPVCTKNVFLKLYSDDVNDMTFWGKKDREDYLRAVREALKEYIQEELPEKDMANG